MMWVLWLAACELCDLDPTEDRSTLGFTQDELDDAVGETDVDPGEVTCDVLCEQAYGGDTGLPPPSEACALVTPEVGDVISVECSHWRQGTNCG